MAQTRRHCDPEQKSRVRFCGSAAATVILSIEYLAQLHTMGNRADFMSSFRVRTRHEGGRATLQFRSPRSFVRSLTSIFSSDRTASLMSRPNCAPTCPVTSLSNLALISSQVNGRVGNPG